MMMLSPLLTLIFIIADAAGLPLLIDFIPTLLRLIFADYFRLADAATPRFRFRRRLFSSR